MRQRLICQARLGQHTFVSIKLRAFGGSAPRSWQDRVGDALHRNHRRLRAKASLTCEEIGDTFRERSENLERAARVALRDGQRGWRKANEDFDSWFNGRCSYLKAIYYNVAKSPRRKPSRSYTLPGILVGVGLGTLTSGFYIEGALFSVFGFGLFFKRWSVHCIDTQDPEALFRWLPRSLQKYRARIFTRLHNEVHDARRIRAGNPFLDLSWTEGRQAANTVNAEKLFDEAMRSISLHPRVREVIGEDVRPVAEPSQVVSRVQSGVEEVFMSWRITGCRGDAEAQLKSRAALLDFIYIFPRESRHGRGASSFVIRSHGAQSMNVDDVRTSHRFSGCDWRTHVFRRDARP